NDPSIRWWLAAGLCMLAGKMDPEEAARVCGSEVGDMWEAVAVPSYYWGQLINGFTVVASHQTPAVAGRWARVLTDVIKREERGSNVPLAEALATLVGRMEPDEAERICGEGVRSLANYLKKHPGDVGAAEGLAVLTARMEPMEAARICGPA